MTKPTKKAPARKAPWKKAPPQGSGHSKLSPAERAKAKRAAHRAGRPYPNLVDNMSASSEGRPKRGKN